MMQPSLRCLNRETPLVVTFQMPVKSCGAQSKSLDAADTL